MPLFIAVFAITTGWYVGTIREVRLGPHGLSVGGWIKKIKIPYANIAHVTATRWLNPERITLVFKTPANSAPTSIFFRARACFRFFPRIPPTSRSSTCFADRMTSGRIDDTVDHRASCNAQDTLPV